MPISQGKKTFPYYLVLVKALGAVEGPFYVMEILAPFCGNYHLKDVRVLWSRTFMGFTVEGCLAGKGKIPLLATLRFLKSYNLFTNVIFELWPHSMRIWEKHWS